MALSDICSSTLNSLANELAHYSDWGYSPQQVKHVIDAMYSLATLGSQLDTPPDFEHPNPELYIHNLVLGSILETEHESYKDVGKTKLKMLADLSAIDIRTANGINAIFKDVTENPKSFTWEINPNVLIQINEIRRFQQVKN